MASNKTRVSAKTEENTYPVEELLKAHKTFNASYEIVAVALKLAGKDAMTVEEASTIIENFKKQEVK